ncbi:MAG: ankyrin repeat domain-containing protein [Gaiellaceae bacterium]
MTELLQALHSGQQDRVEELLAQGPKLNVFEAAALGKVERLRELLEEDPRRVAAFDDDGFQALGLACFYGHVEAARLLLDSSADPNTLARNPHIQSNALHAAAAAENKGPDVRYALCELLLERGADPNIHQGTDDFRAIDAARQNGDDRLERLLLDHGAKP